MKCSYSLVVLRLAPLREIGHRPSESRHAPRKFTHLVQGDGKLDMREDKCVIELAGLGVVVCGFFEFIGDEENCKSMSDDWPCRKQVAHLVHGGNRCRGPGGCA